MKKIKTKKFRAVNGKALIVTADMGKDKHRGYWCCPDGTGVKPFEFANKGSGFQEFWALICRAKKSRHPDEIAFGYKSGPRIDSHKMLPKKTRLGRDIFNEFTIEARAA